MNGIIKKVHNQSRLWEYDLYDSRTNNHLKKAILVNEHLVEIPDASEYLLERGGDLHLGQLNYQKFDSKQKKYEVYQLRKPEKLEREGNTLRLFFNGIDLKQNYVLLLDNERCNVILDPRPGGILDVKYAVGDFYTFGVRRLEGQYFEWRVWSPPACYVEVIVYDGTGKVMTVVPLRATGNGVWQGIANIRNITSDDYFFYNYRIYAYGKVMIGLDPYAPSMSAFDMSGNDLLGMASYINLVSPRARPEGFERTFRNSHICRSLTDVIAYELHIRDFSIAAPDLEPKLRGTYAGCAELIAHLVKMGVTHVQMMPVMNFYTVNENDRNFSGQENSGVNYNWGYDPHHYFSPEGWYSTDAMDPYKRVYELRSLIQRLHSNNIGVIIDVVFNHTYCVEIFENVAPGCYYRFDEQFRISGSSGAGPVLESRRRMVRKFIIDALKHWIEHYHVDGVRFDLMNLMDYQTIQSICEELGHVYDEQNPESFIIFGEGWTFGDLNIEGKNVDVCDVAVTKLHYPLYRSLSLFNDTTRLSIVGKPGDPGYVCGQLSKRDLFATACCGALRHFQTDGAFHSSTFNDPYHRFAHYLTNVLHYISIHDGLTLWDSIRLQMQGAHMRECIDRVRQSIFMLCTLPGRIILQSGDEMFRTKPLALNDPEPHRTYRLFDEQGEIWLHENSYGSADFTNMIRWDLLVNPDHPMHQETVALVDYVSQLIRLRRQLDVFLLTEEDLEIHFLDAYMHEGRYIQSVFRSFQDSRLDQLTICFRGGIAGSRMYVVGEVHPESCSDNPMDNSYEIWFNEQGEGSITFGAEQIRRFSLHRWGLPGLLDLKLVFEPGKWHTLDYAYSPLGKNTIDARMIDKNKTVTINLWQKDDALLAMNENMCPWIAFILSKKRSSDTEHCFMQLLVVHNPTDEQAMIDLSILDGSAVWKVVADNDRVDYEGISSERMTIEGDAIIVQPHSSVALRSIPSLR